MSQEWSSGTDLSHSNNVKGFWSHSTAVPEARFLGHTVDLGSSKIIRQQTSRDVKFKRLLPACSCLSLSQPQTLRKVTTTHMHLYTPVATLEVQNSRFELNFNTLSFKFKTKLHPSVMMHIWNPGTWRVAARASGVQGHFQPHSLFWVTWDPVWKNHKSRITGVNISSLKRVDLFFYFGKATFVFGFFPL